MIRRYEWLFAAYFVYVAIVAFFVRPAIASRAAWVAIAVACAINLLAHAARKLRFFDFARDWLAILYMLLAYREMDWFSPEVRDYHLEKMWVEWDRVLLVQWHLRGAIESLGALIPGYLELAYLLVYGLGMFSVSIFYAQERRDRLDPFLTVYAAGALLSYALFPFFTSDPPRVVFAGTDMPNITTPLRELNLFFVGSYGIHSSVFPSAHVSSAFGAAWGLLFYIPRHPWFGRGMLIYAVSVSVATVYGRYHYAADAVAGFVVSLIPLAMLLRGRARSL